MSKKSKETIYDYIYKNKPFKNSEAALSNLIDGIYDNIVGTFKDDKKLLKSSGKQINDSFNSIIKDIKNETTKYIASKYRRNDEHPRKRSKGKSESETVISNL